MSSYRQRGIVSPIPIPSHATGLTWTAYVSKDGGNYSAAGGAVAAITGGDGYGYVFTPTTADMNGIILLFLFVASDGSRYAETIGTITPEESASLTSTTATVIELADTLDGIVTRLRNRMHDLGISNYTTAELKRAILEAYRTIKMAAKCHKKTIEISTIAGRIGKVALAPTAGGTGYAEGNVLTISTGGAGGTVEVVGVSSGVVTGVRLLTAGSGYTTGTGKATTGGSGTLCTVNIEELEPVLTAGTHTYDVSPLFEVFEASIGDRQLDIVKMNDRGKGKQDWNNTPNNDPTALMQISGSQIRVHPTFDANSLGVIGTLAAAPTAAGTGYAVDEVLTLTSGDGLATAKVLTITGGGSTGPVGTVEIVLRGTGYAVGTGKATTASGAGINCTLSITVLAPLRLHGFSKGTDMLRGSDKPSEIPDGYSVAILDGAAAEACDMRPYTAQARGRKTEYAEKFGSWIEQIKSAVKGS